MNVSSNGFKAFQQGLIHHQRGNLAQAKEIYLSVLKGDPAHFDATHHLGLVHLAQGEIALAERLITRATELRPNDQDSTSNLLYLLNGQKKYAQAIRVYEVLCKHIRPSEEALLLNAGNSYRGAHQYEQAKVLYQQVLNSRANHLQALYNLGGLHLEMGEPTLAKDLLEQAAKQTKASPEIYNNLSIAYRQLGEYESAEQAGLKAVQISPMNPDFLVNWAMAQEAAGDSAAAIKTLKRALEIDPKNRQALTNIGILMAENRQYLQALDVLSQALALPEKTGRGEIHSDIALVLAGLERLDEAWAHLGKAVTLSPTYANGWSNQGLILGRLRRYSEAAKSYKRAHELRGPGEFDLGNAHHMMMMDCDWSDYDAHVDQINRAVREGLRTAEPFGYQAICESETLLYTCAVQYAAKKYPSKCTLGVAPAKSSEKIKIGYVSGEFRQQATSILMTEVWESHDHNRFEIYAFDNDGGDGSTYRQRIESAFDAVISIADLSDEEAVRQIRNLGIHILINLNGYFGKMRQGVFALRAAPIQVNYLGFPGTLGAGYMDYLIADPIVIPPESVSFYSEKIAYLPVCYQANDSKRRISDSGMNRIDVRLPTDAFVFCSFNNSYKITPHQFDLWCQLLKRVPQSILWLMLEGKSARANLRREAEGRGVPESRIIFCERMEQAKHLERHRLADLFLDTYPYNAHTTASDALWAGLPLLTRKGTTFPSRVSESLLRSLGLSELVAKNEEEYVSIAARLAQSPSEINAIRTKLAHQLQRGCELFDGTKMAKNLEALFERMSTRLVNGLGPDHLYPGQAD